MKKNILLFIVSLSILAVSCHSQKTTSDAPANLPETAAIEANAVNPEQVAPPSDAPTACGIGSKTEGDQCICGDMKLPVTDNGHWACIGDVLRCLKADGCFYKGKRYPQLTEIRQGTAYCGHTQAPEQPEGFICTDEVKLFGFLNVDKQDSRLKREKMRDRLNRIFPKDVDSLWWVCNAEEPNSCKCHGLTADKGELCIDRGVIAPNGGIYLTQEDKDQNNPVCGASKYNDIQLKIGKEHLECDDEQWKCQLVYRNGAWECTDEQIEACGGILEPGKNQYECFYNQWMCIDDSCECNTKDADGKDILIHLHSGEICDVSWFHKDEAITDIKSYYSFDENICLDGNCPCGDGALCLEGSCPCGDGTLCLEGNCPCGDGACPRFAECVDNDCRVKQYYSFRGKYDVIDNIGTSWGEFVITRLFENTNDDESGETYLLVCTRPEGCHTPDGRHYNYLAIPDERHLQFHIDGDSNSPDPHKVHNGECILDAAECGTIVNQNKDLQFCKRETKYGHAMFLTTDRTQCFSFDSEEYLESEDEDTSLNTSDFYDYEGDSSIVQKYASQAEHKTNSEMIYDVLKCSGGHRYCNGLNNAPQLVPADYLGYECMDVPSMPDTEATDNLKAWVCRDKNGCQCGDQPCGDNKACIAEKCVDVGIKSSKPSSQSAPKESPSLKRHTVKCPVIYSRSDSNETRIETEEFEKCIYREQYECIFDFITNQCEFAGETMLDGYEHIITRCDQGKYSPEKGCLCGNNYIKDIIAYDCLSLENKEYEVCRLSKGCVCGDEICPNSAACREGQCIDPLTDTPIADSKNAPPLGCHNAKHCECVEATCKDGEFCFDGRCESRIYAKIVNHQRMYYWMDEVFTYQKGGWSGPGAPGPGPEGGVFDILLAPPIPKQPVPDGYRLMPEVICWFQGGGPECTDGFGDLHIRCSMPDGCACGDQTCPMGTECKDGKCIFGTQYANFWCYEDYIPAWYHYSGDHDDSKYGDSYFERSFGITVDEQGRCLCNGTMLNPNLNNHRKEMYSCTRFGWTCRIEDGCECGDIKCPKNAVCIAPGVCSDAFQCGAAECEKDGVCLAPGMCLTPDSRWFKY
ncbi:MAG: hypothetical protein J6A01_08040 [Proteobacteria bacterium]|nr:hypothetical protein [Pseudomonadota bacterium]